MKATCPSCNAHLNIDDKKIPAGGARIKCPTCQNVFPVKPGAGAASAVPLPGSSQPPASVPPPSGAVPLPGGSETSSDSDWEDAPTRMQPAFIPPEAVPGATNPHAPPSNVNEGATRKPISSFKPPAVSGAGGAVPLPGITSGAPQAQSWEEESTRVAAVPIPSAAYKPPPAAVPAPSAHVDFSSFEPTSGGAVPLPGSRNGGVEVSPPTQRIPAPRTPGGAVPLPGSYEPTMAGQTPSFDSQATNVGPHSKKGAVPLPGSFESGGAATHVGPPTGSRGAVPLPGSFEPAGAATHVGTPSRGAVPLPGSFEAAGAATHVGPRGSVPLPGGGDYAPTQIGRGVPLPGQSDYGATHLTKPGAVPLPGEGDYQPTTQQPAWSGDAVPLPGDGNPHSASTAQNPAYQPAQAFSFDSEPTSGASTGLTDVPEASGADFAEVSEPPSAYVAPPSSGGFDFSDLPSPAGQATDRGSFELDTSRPPEANLPSPAGGGSANAGAYDFAPTPAGSGRSQPPPSVNPSASFGEVDLGGGDSLEFDPTSRPKDDLEADLSAPLPPPRPAGPADGLEMLSFIDDTAKEAGARDSPSLRRYHIKRRSGKVFGPFEEAVVVKMLEDGQLLGNEEVSLDSESWQPIGAESAFQGAIAKLMEQPTRGPSGGATGSPGNTAGAHGAPGVSVPNNRPAPPSMERLKQLYEGRMAAIAVVQGKEPVPFRKRIPLIVAGVLVLGIGGTGAWSSTTRYGLFGLKVLFPARVAQNTPEFATLNEAKKSLLADTFKGYKSAKDSGDKLLRTKPYPEVRAVWMQSVYYLHRRYSAASSADLATAQAEQESILLLGEKHVEVVKALAHAAINAKDNDKALSLVSASRARQENEGDLELLFLKAEAEALKGQVPQAMTDLKAVLEKDKKSAKAMHALGLLHLKQKEVDLAAGRFDEALQASPDHVSSAVELASIEVLERKNATKGTELIERALIEENKVNLAPAELGRALALKAQIAAESRKIDDAIAAFEEALKADPTNVFAEGAYGALLVERHDYAKATPMLRDAVDKSPQNLAYIESYLNCLIGLGKMDEATKMMQTASGRFPGNARIAFLSGRVEDGMDRTKQAEESYKRAISADQKMVEANIALAGLYLRLHRFAEAKPQLEEALAKAPDNALVHVGLGELALAGNDVEKAQEELNQAVELNPNLPGAFLGLSRTALAKGKPEVAQTQALKALALDPKIHDGRLQLGTALWKLGKLDEAVKELTQAKEDDPRSVYVPTTLGAVSIEQGDLDAATANLLGNALQKEPGNPDANFYMAVVKRKRAEYTQAVELMKKALDHAPRRAEFHYELGNIFMDARKGNEAVDEWKAALALEPKYADALEALGRNALGRNKQKEAIDFFNKVLDADPTRTRIWALIGEAQAQANQWQKAIDAYLRALGAEPGFKEVYPKLANAYVEKKKLTEGITWYRKAVQADAKDMMSWYNLGYALKDKNQDKDAIAAFEEFLKLNEDPKMKKEVNDIIFDLKQAEK